MCFTKFEGKHSFLDNSGLGKQRILLLATVCFPRLAPSALFFFENIHVALFAFLASQQMRCLLSGSTTFLNKIAQSRLSKALAQQLVLKHITF